MLLHLIIAYYEKSVAALEKDASFNKLSSLPIREEIGRFKYVDEDECKARYEEIMATLMPRSESLPTEVRNNEKRIPHH